MAPQNRQNKERTTRKRQASNVDEMANKCLKTKDNKSENGKKKKGKKQPKDSAWK